jgi:hypothetical protein
MHPAGKTGRVERRLPFSIDKKLITVATQFQPAVPPDFPNPFHPTIFQRKMG